MDRPRVRQNSGRNNDGGTAQPLRSCSGRSDGTNGKTAPLLDNEANFESKWILRYIFTMALVVFCGRAMPLAFLPIVLGDPFHQSEHVVGAVMAVYPLAALLSTPWSTTLARSSQRIVRLHTFAILAISLSTIFVGLSDAVREFCGTTEALVWLVAGRALQGVSASVYLSSNTSLITRMFDAERPYVIAMIEVAVGTGGQLGRLFGGFLFDLGGFSCPFLVISALQLAVGCAGFCFRDRRTVIPDQGAAEATKGSEEASEDSYLTPRVLIGAAAAYMTYFNSGFVDATVSPHIERHLGPVSISVVSAMMSLRSGAYLVSSYTLARILHSRKASFERLILFGSVLASLGLLLMGPQPGLGCSGHSSGLWCWGLQMVSFLFFSMGNAMIFLPSLPLMQSEVGFERTEHVAGLFVKVMTAGEMIGPVCGGFLAGSLGFTMASLIVALCFVPMIVGSILIYDPEVIQARHEAAEKQLEEEPPEDDVFIVPDDGEISFSIRRVSFALSEERRVGVPSSVPSTAFRQPYRRDREQKDNPRQRPYQSAPSEAFRRSYGQPVR